MHTILRRATSSTASSSIRAVTFHLLLKQWVLYAFLLYNVMHKHTRVRYEYKSRSTRKRKKILGGHFLFPQNYSRNKWTIQYECTHKIQKKESTMTNKTGAEIIKQGEWNEEIFVEKVYANFFLFVEDNCKEHNLKRKGKTRTKKEEDVRADVHASVL